MKREVTFCDASGCKNFNTNVCPLCRRDHCSAHEKVIHVELRIDTLQITPFAVVCEFCATWLSRRINNLSHNERAADSVYVEHLAILRKALEEILPLLSAQIAASLIEKS